MSIEKCTVVACMNGFINCCNCLGSGKIACHLCHGIGYKYDKCLVCSNLYSSCDNCHGVGKCKYKCSCNSGLIICSYCEGQKNPCYKCLSRGSITQITIIQ
jgi:hypothetical protein